jgi:hypothetical protein
MNPMKLSERAPAPASHCTGHPGHKAKAPCDTSKIRSPLLRAPERYSARVSLSLLGAIWVPRRCPFGASSVRFSPFRGRAVETVEIRVKPRKLRGVRQNFEWWPQRDLVVRLVSSISPSKDWRLPLNPKRLRHVFRQMSAECSSPDGNGVSGWLFCRCSVKMSPLPGRVEAALARREGGAPRMARCRSAARRIWWRLGISGARGDTEIAPPEEIVRLSGS